MKTTQLQRFQTFILFLLLILATVIIVIVFERCSKENISFSFFHFVSRLGVSLIVTCINTWIRAETIYVCFACRESFAESNLREHLESKRHLIDSLVSFYFLNCSLFATITWGKIKSTFLQYPVQLCFGECIYMSAATQLCEYASDEHVLIVFYCYTTYLDLVCVSTFSPFP